VFALNVSGNRHASGVANLLMMENQMIKSLAKTGAIEFGFDYWREHKKQNYNHYQNYMKLREFDKDLLKREERGYKVLQKLADKKLRGELR
jgi:hypothetical protein